MLVATAAHHDYTIWATVDEKNIAPPTLGSSSATGPPLPQLNVATAWGDNVRQNSTLIWGAGVA